MDAGEAVFKFLESVGSQADAQFYLKQFRSAERERFAALTVDAPTLDSLGPVAVDLQFLQALELTPIVVPALHVGATLRHCELLRKRLLAEGVDSAVFTDMEQIAPIVAAARSGRIPIVRLRGDSEVARVRRLGDLLSALGTGKLIHLREDGGLRAHGKRLSFVNLTTEREALLKGGGLDPRARALIEHAQQLVERVPQRLLIAVASPINLLRELFTAKGAGTLLRSGARIERHTSYAALDLPRLERLITESFAKPLHPGFFERPIAAAYLESDYRGVALIADSPFGSYLTKFAVTREARGEGIGRDLWQAFIDSTPRLLWRARPDNPITAWYEQQADGRFRCGDWVVYLRGIEPERIAEAIRFALEQPPDFAPTVEPTVNQGVSPSDRAVPG
jgi:GNAT superfamily N-acetyltransferase